MRISMQKETAVLQNDSRKPPLRTPKYFMIPVRGSARCILYDEISECPTIEAVKTLFRFPTRSLHHTRHEMTATKFFDKSAVDCGIKLLRSPAPVMATWNCQSIGEISPMNNCATSTWPTNNWPVR
jgi:hypothetical protein